MQAILSSANLHNQGTIQYVMMGGISSHWLSCVKHFGA